MSKLYAKRIKADQATISQLSTQCEQLEKDKERLEGRCSILKRERDAANKQFKVLAKALNGGNSSDL